MNSFSDTSITLDPINHHPKITIIRENNHNHVKMNSYPKLPITTRSAYRKDIQLHYNNTNHSNIPSYKSSISQSPLSNISCESLPNMNHYNAFSEQDLSGRMIKLNEKESNRRHSELNYLHSPYDHYSYQHINQKKLNGDIDDHVDNVQLTTWRHNSYDRNLDKNSDEDPIQPIIIQRHYGSNNYISSKPLDKNNLLCSEHHNYQSNHYYTKNVSFIMFEMSIKTQLSVKSCKVID
ncbi:unnamed protein product [Schistosoma mattheei]|uniref:Uncharacterized protein n=1 Tax=Schistosoma mattheei TaxID=31246 RepID=A0A3P8J124_9TREM|nr:unnamed protein product [Schistosoma mattheei]